MTLDSRLYLNLPPSAVKKEGRGGHYGVDIKVLITYNNSMDFQKTLRIVIEIFEKFNVKYGITGGFGMGLLGIVKATIDIDFLIERDGMKETHPELIKKGYERIHFTNNVSQYTHKRELIDLDFIHAFREISLSMLERTVECSLFDEKLRISVLQPEDIIGLKIQAIVNDDSRFYKEIADIQEIMEMKEHLDKERIKYFFSLFGMEKTFNEIN